MNEHQLNLIAEYAAGSLPADEVEAVEAKIASDPAARAEYEAQLAALGALRAAPAAQMTAGERAALRAAVAEELHIVREEPVEEPSGWWRRPIPWARLGTAAAVLAAVVIAAPFLNTLSTSGDGAADDFGDVSAEAPVATSALNRSAGDDLALAGSESDAAAATEPLPTMAAGAPTEEGVANPEFAGPLSVADFGVLTEPELAMFYSSLEGGLPDESPFNAAIREGAVERLGDEFRPDVCRAEAEAAVAGFETAVFFGIAELDGTPVLLFFVTPPGPGNDILLVLDQTTCEVVAQFGP